MGVAQAAIWVVPGYRDRTEFLYIATGHWHVHGRGNPVRPQYLQNELLREPTRAAEYLMRALHDGDEIDFRLALAAVVRARTVTGVAQAAGIHRTTLHRMLNPENRPTFSSLLKALAACDLDLVVAAAKKRRHRAGRSRP